MSTRIETGGWLLLGGAWVAVTLSVLCAASSSLRIRIRIRRGRPRLRPQIALGRGLSILGFALALSGSPASAQGRPPVPPGRVSLDVPTPPWTATGGSLPPPPPVPFEASPLPADPEIEEGEEVDGVEQPQMKNAPGDGSPGSDVDRGPAADLIQPAPDGAPEAGSGPVETSSHPALHGRREQGRIPPLFPRAGSKMAPGPFDERLDRMAAMQRHPAGRSLEARATQSGHAPSSLDAGSRRNPSPTPRTAQTYTVRVGDSLWSIAAEVLGTDDLARIARYWPRIHRSNPHITDPNLIRPGEVLRLPEETTR
jgi:hypothetical protein